MAKNGHKMAKNDQKWIKVAKNGQKEILYDLSVILDCKQIPLTKASFSLGRGQGPVL
jgi:hypothetical protein